jgi:predicted  nucleic acid-binding Zn-ribbon protein
MLPLLQQLKEISEVDALLAQTREQLALYPKMLKKLLDAEAAEQKKAEAARARGEAARAERRRADQAVSALREKIKKMTSQQSMVKTTKEFETLSAELEKAGQKIDELETRGLELLEAEELAAREQAVAEKAWKKLVAEQAEEQERIQAQIRDKQERLQRLSGEQQRKVKLLPDDWQETYASLNERWPGSAVVRMAQGQCGGCHYSLTLGAQQHVRGGEMLVRCEHCRRVLYHDA